MHAEELEVIPEQPTMSIEPTVHPSNKHRSIITFCAVQTHDKIPRLCTLVTCAEAMPLPKILIFNTSLKWTYSTQRPKTSDQAPEIAASSSSLDRHQLSPCGSAYLGFHHFTPPNKYRIFKAGRGLRHAMLSCHAVMPRGHACKINSPHSLS